MKLQKLQILVLSLLMSATAFAGGKVEFDVILNPVGDFVSKTDQVKSRVKPTKNGFIVNAQLDLTTLKTGVELRDEHMIDNYFEAKKSKKNRFAIVTAKTTSPTKFNGFLVVRGVKKPISGTWSKKGNNIEATFKTLMSDYKIKKAKYMGVGAEDEVEVRVNIPMASSAPGSKRAKK